MVDKALVEVDVGDSVDDSLAVRCRLGIRVAAARQSLDIGTALVIRAVILGDKQDADRVGRFVFEHCPETFAVVARSHLVRVYVAQVAVELSLEQGEAAAGIVTQRTGYTAFRTHFIAVEIGEIDVSLEVLARPARRDIDDSG